MAKDKLFEQILILRCQLRDRDALAELIGRYDQPLRYFINRLMQDHAKAEELFQETWLAVIRKIHTLKRPEAFTTWLYRIARNKVYQELRDRKQFTELHEELAAPDVTDDELSLSDDVAKLHKCLERLTPEHKEVLMLRFLEQMSYEQMAEVLDCNLGTVRSRIHFAKLALKKEMEK
jgi:RNA polymerase sigma-70 factor (ECF subfamily)